MPRSGGRCLSTPHLTLIPFSSDLLGLLLADRGALETRLSARFLPRWDREDEVDFLTRIRCAVERHPATRVWHIYFIVHNRDNAVIGNVGFHGPPDRAGAVELHGGLVPAYRKQGYALEALHALVLWAFTRPEVRLVTGVCHFDNAEIIRVCQKLGMRLVGVRSRSLWCLWSGIGALEKVGMRPVSALLQRRLSRGLRGLVKLGMLRRVPSLVWHLPKDRWTEG